DSFAEEIARLALTLADIPNPNGWNIQHSDIYENDILEKAAQKATILFCNPPFENFSPEEQKKYGNSIKTGNKAAEVMAKTLPNLPPNSVFGIILPQGFLHKKNLANLRRYILDDYELRYICNLPEKVFEKSRHLSTVLLGRKNKVRKNITYLCINRSNLERFKNTYQTSEILNVSKDELLGSKNCSFRIIQLKDVWDYKTGLILEDICDIGKGLEYKGKERNLPKNAITFSNEPFKNGVEGFAYYDRKITLTELPQIVYLNLSDEVIRRPQWGVDSGKPQVLLNYSRVSSEPWRLKAWIDEKGHPVTSNFLVVRSKDLNEWSLSCIWALLNSPYTNAFAYCQNMERSNITGVMRVMPVPKINRSQKDIIDSLVLKYFSVSKSITTGSIPRTIKQEAKSILLEIDAEILRLYNLPPRLEKMVLDFFESFQRRGVDFKFDRYYPEGFDSYIPLHMYISKEFQDSSVENVKKWIESNRSPEVIEAFKIAAKIKK
ncbi:MAG: N-6 DNA methylase, partial [Sedimentisphaerales bacterium]|nr:N-6 DNA methylase [Sedimentisphaerales bacterium]